jgi:hypothetical protein
VQDPNAIVRTAPARGSVVLAGDGEGIVDASAAGLLDGKQLVLQVASLDDASLQRSLDDGAALVLTDTNRRRFRNFFSSIRETAGATERAGQTTTDPNGYEFRLDPFTGVNDDSRTVVEQRGGQVDASRDGGADRPEDRPVHAFDGDVRTVWRVGGAHPTNEHITLRPDKPTTASSVNFVQPLDGPRDRVITKVRLRFDDGSTVTADLGERSFTKQGETVTFPERTFSEVEIDIAKTSKPPFDPQFANAVGFAEVRIGGVHVEETVRLPVDLAKRTGSDATGHGLDVVMTRQRIDPADIVHQDEELALDRSFTVPDERAYALTGTARVNPRAGDAAIDDVMGTHTDGWVFRASSHLPTETARASRAFDNDPKSAWTSAFAGQEGQWIEAAGDEPVRADSVGLTFVADGRHSVPTEMQLVADGKPVRTLTVPPITDGDEPGATASVTIPFASVKAKRLRLVVQQVRHPDPSVGGNFGIAPVSITDIRFPEVPIPQTNDQPDQIATGCRDDLLTVDGRAYPVEIAGAATDARRGLTITSCEPSNGLSLRAGEHHVVAAKGLDTAVDLDRLVLSSGPAGDPVAVAPRGSALATSGATVVRSVVHATSADVTLRSDGTPFWFVFGESYNRGWDATTGDAAKIGERQLVDGFANGWFVEPSEAGTITVHLRWAPQRTVWAGLAASLVAIVACIVLAFVTARRARRRNERVDLADDPYLAWRTRDRTVAPWPATLLFAAGAGIATVLVAPPWIALVAALVALGVCRWPAARAVPLVGAPAVLMLSRAVDRPDFGWLALALFAVALACDRVRGAASGSDYGHPRMPDAAAPATAPPTPPAPPAPTTP